MLVKWLSCKGLRVVFAVGQGLVKGLITTGGMGELIDNYRGSESLSW